MSLWLSTDIFKLRRNLVASYIPDPRGPLSRLVPSSLILSANKKVQSVLESKEHTQSGRKGQRYSKLAPELKAEYQRRAAEHVVAATVKLAMGVVNLKDGASTAW